MNFTLTSTAFEDGRHIPLDYTAAGRDVSPPLKWFDPPSAARVFALICEDPDAPRGTFTHWLIYNMPAESRELSEAITRAEGFPNGIVQGLNDFGRLGYNGPSPPGDDSHRYFFRLYALDARLDLPGGARKAEFLQALRGHVLAETQLVGHFGRGEIHEIPDDLLAKQALQNRESIHMAP